MSLFNTLSTGASGLGAASTSLAVIGDNIANIGTYGFKGSNATFADSFPNYVSGLGGVAQVGSGARFGDSAVDFAQGTIAATASAIDVAIVGNGFFEVSDGQNNMFSRDGSFHLDLNNTLVNTQGLAVQGYQALNGVVTSTVGDITIDPAGMSQQQTTNIDVTANLAPNPLLLPTVNEVADLQAAQPFDGTLGAPSLDQVTAAADYTTSVNVYDSLGKSHAVTLVFEKDDTSGVPNQWNVYAVIDGGEVDTDGDGAPDGIPGQAFEIGEGTVQFDTAGNLIANSGMSSVAGWTFPGASVFAPTFNFGLDALGNTTPGGLTQQGTESYTTTIAQDGYAAGTLESIEIDPDGTIRGVYTNGQDEAVGQLALATFSSNAGLERLGSNLYGATIHSGEPALGAAGAGGRGTTSGYSLEASNVDLEDQFVAMIQAQRSYQANTGTIRTANDALQQLMQLV